MWRGMHVRLVAAALTLPPLAVAARPVAATQPSLLPVVWLQLL